MLFAQDRGRALAGKSTLNRLEWGAVAKDVEERYWRIGMRPQAIDRLLVELFVEAHSKPPRSIVLDLDATDDPLHGEQEGRFFHGYYGSTAACRCTSSVAITCFWLGCDAPWRRTSIRKKPGLTCFQRDRRLSKYEQEYYRACYCNAAGEQRIRTRSRHGS
jgi:hypothetical protein